MRYIPDFLCLLGFTFMAFWLWLSWPPLALIIGGALFVAFGFAFEWIA